MFNIFAIFNSFQSVIKCLIKLIIQFHLIKASKAKKPLKKDKYFAHRLIWVF